MASVEEQHSLYNDDDLDDDDVVVDEEDDDVDVDYDDDSTSSPPPPPTVPPVSTNSGAGGEVTVAVVGVPASGGSLMVNVPHPVAVEEKKPSAAFDDSRKLFQRLWTDEDEIELLQGFLEYTAQRGGINSSSSHHDTTAFYEQIKSKLQLDFNKNQLVEKLRRLKKKYRNVMSKMGSGKDFVFKSSHDQATFQISRQIWSNVVVRGGGAAAAPPPPPEYGGLDDEDSHLNLNANFIDHSPNINFNFNPNGTDKTPKSRKRSRVGAVKVEEKHSFVPQYYQPSGVVPNMVLPISTAAPAPVPAPAPMTTPIQMAAPQATAPPPSRAGSIPSLIEETVRSCLSPIFKELLNNVTNLNGSRSFGFAMASSPIPLGFGSCGSMSADMMQDEKWRKQQILELEVYSKRLDLVQDQIKAQLEELRSMDS